MTQVGWARINVDGPLLRPSVSARLLSEPSPLPSASGGLDLTLFAWPPARWRDRLEGRALQKVWASAGALGVPIAEEAAALVRPSLSADPFSRLPCRCRTSAASPAFTGASSEAAVASPGAGDPAWTLVRGLGTLEELPRASRGLTSSTSMASTTPS